MPSSLPPTRLLPFNAQRAAFLFIATAALIACKPKADVPKSDSPSATVTPQPPATPDRPSQSLDEFGYGPIKAGLTFAEANEGVKGALKAAAGANLAECDYVKWDGGPAGLNVMVLEGKIARVDVIDGSTVTTAEGAKIGDSEEQIQSLYGNRVTVTNHKYDDGHYLTVRSANAADTMHVIVFETVKGKVTRFRGGAKPGVEFVEGCS